MSACMAETDWRFLRAVAVIESGVRDIPFAYYEDIFDMDFDEVIYVFHIAAMRCRVFLAVMPNPVLH